MKVFEKVGYAQASASGRTLKIYEGTRFIGLLSFVDIEHCKKSSIFVATITKPEKLEIIENAEAVKEPDHRRRFSLYFDRGIKK